MPARCSKHSISPFYFPNCGVMKGGPSYYKIEGKVLYNLEDVISFIEKSKVRAR